MANQRKRLYLYLTSLILLGIFFGGCSLVNFDNSRALDAPIIKSTITSSESSNNEIIQSANNQISYQYAAPWDKDLFDRFYSEKRPVPQIGEVKGGIVPHHLLAGYVPATFFDYLSKQTPYTIVLVGPNHFHRGQGAVISTLRDWQTPYGELQTDKELVSRLTADGLVNVDEEVVKEEHSIYNLISFIRKSLPLAKVVPLILRYQTPSSTLDNLTERLKNILPQNSVIVASVDFSHYQTLATANFHDEVSRSVIRSFNFGRLPILEIDSVPSVYTLLKLMQYYGTQKIGFEINDNSALILRNSGLKETTSYYSPYFTRGEPSFEHTASILNFGDMMLDRNVKRQIDRFGRDYLFKELAGGEQRFFKGVDVIAANLEGPFANSRRYTTKSIAFRFDPALIPMLKKYNFSLFTNANNHSFDMGAAGFEESKNNLRRAGIDFYGSQYRVDNESMIIKRVGDFNIAFIGINDTNSPVSAARVKELIGRGGELADFVVLNIHWGAEYQTISNMRQRSLARQFVDAGADVIIGHHPHVVQEMEIYKNRPIFYSLGNFIFDQYFSTPTQQGLAIGLVLYNNKISAYLYPLEGAGSQVKLMDRAKAERWMRSWLATSRIGQARVDNFKLEINF